MSKENFNLKPINHYIEISVELTEEEAGQITDKRLRQKIWQAEHAGQSPRTQAQIARFRDDMNTLEKSSASGAAKKHRGKHRSHTHRSGLAAAARDLPKDVRLRINHDGH